MYFKRAKVVIFILIIFLIPTNDNLVQNNIENNGDKGASVPNPSINVGNLQDKSYTYTGADCVVYDYGVTIDDFVTVVVIDEGLLDKEWKALEQNPVANIDIIGFLTKTATGSIKWIDNPDDSYLDDQENHVHGFATTSVLASIARNVKVLFVDIKMVSIIYGTDPYGFNMDDLILWQWINNNSAFYDIDIITWSQSSYIDFINAQIEQEWNDLLNDDIIMLSSVGNYGNYLNKDENDDTWIYPPYYTQWYAIGSIDHETRSTGVVTSLKDHKSSFSSWYLATTTGNHIVNWLSPGNGIPALTSAYYDSALQCFTGTWRYHCGTSYSSPYLAAIIALIITGYHNGIDSSTDPTINKIEEILQYSSSRSTFDQKMGYGYIDTYIAYGRAYYEGRIA